MKLFGMCKFGKGGKLTATDQPQYEEKEGANGMETLQMRVKLDSGATMMNRAHKTDAGIDLFSREFMVIRALDSAVFDTGVHVELPPGYFGKIESKSGLNVNHGIVSCGGVIDEGYTGSIKVKLYNLGEDDYTVNICDKIAQLVILPYAVPEIRLVEALGDTERGDNGFGSTGR